MAMENEGVEMRGKVLFTVGVLVALWGIVVIATAVLAAPLGPDALYYPTAIALVLFFVGALLSWLGYRRMN